MYSLIENNTIKSVLQNIQLLLSTQKGSDPLRPDFGIDYFEILDNPTPLNVGKIKSIILDAIEQYEPRAKVKEMKIDYSNIANGRVVIRLTLGINDEDIEWKYVLQK